MQIVERGENGRGGGENGRWTLGGGERASVAILTDMLEGRCVDGHEGSSSRRGLHSEVVGLIGMLGGTAYVRKQHILDTQYKYAIHI